jgi:phosphate uptake regulator
MIQFDNHAFKGVDEGLKKLADVQQHMGESILALLALFESSLDSTNLQAFVDAKVIDKTINTDEQLVNATVANMINKFTLVGEELRYTLGSIKTAAALERGADKIKNAIKWLARANYPLNSTMQQSLAEASAALTAMIPLALRQLVDFYPDAAEELLAEADRVQRAYRTILVLNSAADSEAPLLLVAKNLEQTADMAVEIMKICHFVHEGSKYEKSSDK